MKLILALLVVFGLLIVNELWWREHRHHGELSRKFVHITVGSFVAFWPFFMSWLDIELFSLAFLIVVSISKYWHIFQAIHSVGRPTLGEIYFAVAVGGLTFVSHNKWVYAAAILQMSLADGLAAVLGVAWGKSNRYKVFGQTKSLVGSLTFLVTSTIILIWFIHFSGLHLDNLLLIALAAGACFVENIGILGLDNLFVPLMIAGFLRLLN